MAGTFQVRFPGAGASSGSDVMSAYNQARQLQMAEDRAALAQLLTQRTLARDAAEQRAQRAVMGAEDQPLELAPARTLAVPGMPAVPSTLGPSETPGGMLPGRPVGTMGAGEPPISGAPPMALPDAPAAETTIAGQAAVAPSTITEPAITEPGVTQSAIRKTLAGDPAALAALGGPAGQQAMKARGVLSNDELRYREGLALANRESKEFMGKVPDLLKAGDSLSATMAMHSYYQRLSEALSRKDPQRASDARKLSETLFLQAVKLQEDKAERGLADADAATIAKTMATFNKAGGQTPEHLADMFAALGQTKSKWGHTFYQHLIQTSLPKAIEKIQDQPYQDFFGAYMVAMSRGSQTGTADPYKAFQAASLQYPETALRMLGDKGHFGEWARKAAFPTRTPSRNDIELMSREVDAEEQAKAASNPNYRPVGPHDPGYGTRVLQKVMAIRANPDVNVREKDRRDSAQRRESRLGLQAELGSVKDDIRRLTAEMNSRNLTRDPALVQKDLDAKIQARDALVGRIKALQGGASASDEDTPDAGNEEVRPPASGSAPVPVAPAPAAQASSAAPLVTPDAGRMKERALYWKSQGLNKAQTTEKLRGEGLLK